jgi:hypothetical protein
VDKFKYRLLYRGLFGGVTAFSVPDFIAANGYPTIYWGWGGEDDDMYGRVTKKLKKQITRYPIEIARYTMIRTMNHISGKVNPDRHALLYSNYNFKMDSIQFVIKHIRCFSIDYSLGSMFRSTKNHSNRSDCG